MEAMMIMNRRTLLGDPPPIHITSHDYGRLDALLANLSTRSVTCTLEFLRRELDRARLVDAADPQMPFVRIGSRVLFEDERGKRYRRTLALPGAAPGDSDKISLLTPVGAALLGLTEGQSISYETPDDHIKTVTVLKVSADQSQTD
jgi:regulator of nucleoside diphosphate kinase